ncbi:patatin-like phospholipase family protein [Candidatus Gracilibacteria bacterium]|nr:patatin-like phospholipase family protein [Candidatus Gracilibacteria bacterium]
MKKKAALVCSGGGALGAAQLGVLKALEERYEFDFYAGVSAGSILVCLHSSGFDADESWEIVQKMNVFDVAFDFSLQKSGMLKGKKMLKLFDKIFSETKLENLSHPTFVGTTDFQTGENILLHSGKISDALRASCSVPVLFEPYFHPEKKRWLVDGGLTENLPLSIALKKYKGDTIIAIDTNYMDTNANFKDAKNGGLQKLLNRTIKIFINNQHSFPHPDKRIRRILLPITEFTPSDALKLKAIYKQGLEIGKNTHL